MSAADFEKAVNYIKNAPAERSYTNDEQLAFYKYFKQATVGNVQGERPGIFSMKERAKWDAWNEVKGLSSEEAKTKYVELLDKCSKVWRK